MLTERRRAARTAVLLLLAACLLAGLAPAAVELAEQGWTAWVDVRPFQDGPAEDRDADDDRALAHCRR